MKILATIIVFSISFICYGTAQTVEEILTKTEEGYRSMKNYVDEGEVIDFRYADWRNVFSKDHTETKKYVSAHDDAQNVYHFIRRDNQEAIGTDYIYSKSSDSRSGSFKRIHTSKTELENYTLNTAVPRLGAPVLFHSVGLHYPEMFQYKSKGVLRHYATAERLNDSIINGDPCFVIDLYNEHDITKENIDLIQHMRDSTNKADGTFYDYGEEMKPHTIRGNVTYFIRREDNLIVREHHYSYRENNEKKLSLAVLMNPRMNVDNFETYLAEKN